METEQQGFINSSPKEHCFIISSHRERMWREDMKRGYRSTILECCKCKSAADAPFIGKSAGSNLDDQADTRIDQLMGGGRAVNAA